MSGWGWVVGLGGKPHAPCSVPIGEASYWVGERVMDVSPRLLVSAWMLMRRCGEGREADREQREGGVGCGVQGRARRAGLAPGLWVGWSRWSVVVRGWVGIALRGIDNHNE